ncbi:3'-5' exonuclease [Candidatus Saccharibacteria bacterium]|nr:3'-5' exonuclease [Candidatus Saccharibacteria bacterium]
MLDKPIAIIDIETTGGVATHHRITEVGIIKIHNGKIIDEFTTLVNPGRDIPYFITELTGIDNKAVRDAPYFDEIADRLEGIFRGSYFMAHHVMFDFSFVKRQMNGLGYDFNPKKLCSVKLSRALEKGVSGHSLEKIIARNNIPVKARHRAYDDAKAVKDFMYILIDRMGIDRVKHSLEVQLR